MSTFRGKYSTPEKAMTDDPGPCLWLMEEIKQQALSTGIQKMAVTNHRVRKCIEIGFALSALCLRLHVLYI